MTRVEEIEKAVASLPVEEYRQFRDWFLERDWAQWDKQIHADSESGKLDFLVKEAMEEKSRGIRLFISRKSGRFGLPG
jgi:hypothetical protein